MDSALRILADAEKVRQVFLNILLNAVQSIGEQGHVHVHARATEDLVGIFFEDTGAGMPEGQLAHIFSPFYTTKEKGTGLGLAVSQKIVEGHGGRIAAQSTPGKGTTLEVWLPRAE